MYKLSLVFVVLLLASVVLARSWFESERCLVRGISVAGEKDFASAGSAYACALSWRSPFNTAAETARAKLQTVFFDASEPITRRREAGYQLRRGLVSSEHWLNRNSTRADVLAIDAALNALPEDRVTVPVTEANPPIAHPLFQMLAQIAFWSWIGMTLGIIWRGFDASGKIALRPFALFSIASATAYGAWLLLLAKA